MHDNSYWAAVSVCQSSKKSSCNAEGVVARAAVRAQLQIRELCPTEQGGPGGIPAAVEEEAQPAMLELLR